MKKCSLCKNTQLRIISKKVRDSKKHKIIECIKCGLIQLNPLPNHTELSEFYDKDRQAKNAGINFNIATMEKKAYEDTKRRVKLVQNIAKRRDKILEIGSGHGFFLKGMLNLGFNVTGIEISKQRREITKKILGINVLDVNLNENKEILGKFDIILLFHVLEHVAEPIKFLKNIKTMLTKNGKIIIEVPNVEDHQVFLNEAYNAWYWQKAHLSYFSPDTLRLVLQKAKFKNISIKGIQRYSIENFFYWIDNKQPQLLNPTMNLSMEFEWIEKYYKKHLEKNLTCDTILCMAQR